ncbi:MAG: 50S ribosomal protein L5, partial [Lentisphaerae bacterium]|nr:50S ribosomal protein L5 [Lentisphaerota bacterium]
MMARLKDLYKEKITPELRETLGLDNPMLVPRLEKVVVNMGFGIVEKDEQKSLLE